MISSRKLRYFNNRLVTILSSQKMPLHNVSSNIHRVNVQLFQSLYIKQSCTTTIEYACSKTLVFISYYSMCSSFCIPSYLDLLIHFFHHPIPYSIPQFLNMIVLHYKKTNTRHFNMSSMTTQNMKFDSNKHHSAHESS